MNDSSIVDIFKANKFSSVDHAYYSNLPSDDHRREVDELILNQVKYWQQQYGKPYIGSEWTVRDRAEFENAIMKAIQEWDIKNLQSPDPPQAEAPPTVSGKVDSSSATVKSSKSKMDNIEKERVRRLLHQQAEGLGAKRKENTANLKKKLKEEMLMKKRLALPPPQAASSPAASSPGVPAVIAGDEYPDVGDNPSFDSTVTMYSARSHQNDASTKASAKEQVTQKVSISDDEDDEKQRTLDMQEDLDFNTRLDRTIEEGHQDVQGAAEATGLDDVTIPSVSTRTRRNRKKTKFFTTS